MNKIQVNNGRIVLTPKNTLQTWQPAPAPPPPILIEPRRQIQTQPLGYYLAVGWQRYGVARNAFVQPVTTGYYAYERRTGWRVCALAAIYIGLSGDSAQNVYGLDFNAVEYGITRMTGINLAYVYAPAVASMPGVQKGEPVSLLGHLAHLTDNHWPAKEIIHYCLAAQAWHNEHRSETK
jgi:hypothetical protein